jgi:enoyl-[acyl-carrier protein] reductase/trans-2-enoyl-CoA reductase (NAD+)
MRSDVQEKIAGLWQPYRNFSGPWNLEGYRSDFHNLFGFGLMV